MNIKRSIESLLFVSPKPLSLKELADVLDKKTEEVEKDLQELIDDYKNNDRGILIIENSKKYQMSSSPESAAVVQKFMQSEVSGELTPASLETLTIIAYRGPIKKKDIEKIRGINCSLILKNLLIRGLVEEKSADEIEDNIYTVSLDFVKFLGISSLNDLPDYEKFNNNEEIDKLLGKINNHDSDDLGLEVELEVGADNETEMLVDDSENDSEGDNGSREKVGNEKDEDENEEDEGGEEGEYDEEEDDEDENEEEEEEEEEVNNNLEK
ncbi:MAG: SMC-Scp complex subunit ScpB [Patescibacteria group bacterium]|nr:SMC-Scp complex subunit ScpB [Patescibacteria group bacterium]